MNRRKFLSRSLAAAAISGVPRCLLGQNAVSEGAPPVTVMLVDTDRVTTPVDKRIYGQFLEHIYHSVVDGLFAEQIRGAGFEGDDFKTYWESSADRGEAELVNLEFQNGSKSVRLRVSGGRAAILQGRVFLEAGIRYEGSLWLKPEEGSPHLQFVAESSEGKPIASVPLAYKGSDWQEVPFAFTSTIRDRQARVAISASGKGSVLVDFVSMMRADARQNGMFRPDLLQALSDPQPAFIRWPGGSYASTYKWKEGIGRYAARGYHPNTVWGGYSDYYGFGTDEFLALCRKVGAEPLIVLPAPGTKPEQVAYAMDWVRYLNDPPSTDWGRKRAANGHREPYEVKLFQIDNEPMNNGFTPESYAEIVNLYGSRLRELAPHARIV